MFRARSTTFRNSSGQTFSIVNVGLPSDHPMAHASEVPGARGLHNMNIMGIPMPAPQFVVAHRARPEGGSDT